MSAGLRATERRPVLVTIEGEAYRPHHDDDVQIIVRKDGGKIVLPDNAAGVTIEDVTPARVWTDGDLLEHRWGWIAWRQRGEWWTTTQAKAGTLNASGPFADDAKVDQMLREESPHLTVLRYQHGGDR